VTNLGQWSAELLQWGQTNQGILAWLFGLSLLLFVSSLVAIPVLVAKMRADYFVRREPDTDSWLGRHPAARATCRLLKNALGTMLLLVGLAMIVLPGQGVITILVALSLLEFPGKRRLEIRLIRQRHVGRGVNWIRERAGRPPLLIPESTPDKRNLGT
jgi:hypothetical protein